MTFEEAKRACEENLLCLYHLPKRGPYIPAEDIHVYIIATAENFWYEFLQMGTPETKPWPESYAVKIVPMRQPEEHPSIISGLKHIQNALRLASEGIHE